MAYLKLDGISFHYGKVRVLDNVSFTVNRGEIFGLIGPNGCGKSTMLKIICGLLETEKPGKIMLDQKEIKPDKIKSIIGYCPQENSFFDKLTLKENLAYFSHLYNLKGSFDKLIVNVLDSVGLVDKANEMACNLSGGMKRRLNIACGIMHEPQILLMDEPSIELDPESRSKIWNLVKSIRNSGKTIILATNLMEEAHALCDRIAMIRNGRLDYAGSAREATGAL